MTSIPAFHTSGSSAAKGKGKVFISSRKDASASGIFTVSIAAQFNPPADDYPAGSLLIDSDLNDSVKGSFTATSIELINSYGKANPTIYLTGRCKYKDEKEFRSLRYWIMIADNKEDSKDSAQVVGFVIHDNKGNRVAYGTGDVLSGSIVVKAS